MRVRLAIIAACAGPVVRPTVVPSTLKRDALLVLPGFGYGRTEDQPFRSVAVQAAAEGVDL